MAYHHPACLEADVGPLQHCTNVTEIIDIINKLKPKYSSGVDDLSNKVIKHIQEIVAEPLTIIINQMINTRIFPD